MRVPIALLALTLSGALPSSHTQSRHFNSSGAILLAASIGMLLLALVLSQRPTASGWMPLSLLVVGLVLLHRYVMRSLNSAEPIIRPELFADAAFTIPTVMNAGSKSGGLCHPAANALLPHERTAPLSHYNGINAGARLHGHARRGASGGATRALVRPAADSLFRYRARGSGSPAAWPHGPRSCRSHSGISTCTRRSGARIAQRRLHRPGDRHTARAGPRCCGQPCDVDPNRGHRLRRLRSPAPCKPISPAGADFLAGYRFAFLSAGGGLLIALALSCFWWRAWFGRCPGRR